MKRLGSRLAALLVVVSASTLTVRAQGTFELVGKVTDADGSGIPGVVVKGWNQAFPDAVRQATTDKKGNYFLPGLLYSQQNREWVFSFEAEGLAPKNAKVVGRMGDRTIYAEFERAFTPGSASFEISVRGIGEVRAEVTMGPPTPAGAPVSVGAEAGAGGADEDPWAAANRKVQAGDLEGSLELFKKAIEAAPTDPERRELFARVLLKLDRSGDALIQARKAMTAAPERVESRMLMADIHASRGENEPAAALVAEALKLRPDDVGLLERSAWLAADLGKNEEAIGAYEKVVAARPDDKEAWLALGGLYHRAKRPSDAERAYKKVTELDPANAHQIFFNLGVLIADRPNLAPSDNAKAIEAFEKAVEIKPDYARAWQELGYAQLRAGRLGPARAALERYLELAPKAPDAAEIRETVKGLPKAKP